MAAARGGRWVVRARRYAGPLVVSALLLGCGLENAHAAKIRVTTAADSLALDGACSLREAVRAANLDVPVDSCPAGTAFDVIRLGATTYNLTIAEDNDEALNENGDLDVAGAMRIEGQGFASAIAGASSRVIEVLVGGALTLRRLNVRNGSPGLAEGGGVRNAGTLTLVDVALFSNSSGVSGGGIWSSGRLVLHGAYIANNGTGDDFAHKNGYPGGGVYSLGSLAVSDSTITANSGGDGAGIAAFGRSVIRRSTISQNQFIGVANSGSMRIADTTIEGNRGSGAGGGIANGGTLILERSTVHNNSTIVYSDPQGVGGAGIFNAGVLRVLNSTISGNFETTDVGAGGGIASTGSLSILATTIAGNIAGDFHAPMGTGGGIAVLAGTAAMRNTIVANNQALVGPDCSGDLGAVQASLLTSPADCHWQKGWGNLLGVDPLLAAFSANGGPTLTQALSPGSPAIDAGLGSRCPPLDQRLVSRPQDGNGDGIPACDIGAYEALPQAAPNP